MTVGPVTRDDITAEFFEGTAKGEFLLRRCPRGHFGEPSVRQCPVCGATELSWSPAAGSGTIVSFAVAHGRQTSERDAVRVVLAAVELEEGPWWYSQVVDADPEVVAIGARVNVEFRRVDDTHEAVPVFTLV